MGITIENIDSCNAALTIRIDNLTDQQIVDFLRDHVRALSQLSPPESCHALDLEELKKPNITVWSVWKNQRIVGCGALKELDPLHGEVKSMRTSATELRQGVGTRVLQTIISTAQRRGYRRLSLETGSGEPFFPAHALYRKFGFQECPPFARYRPDPNSLFMSKEL